MFKRIARFIPVVALLLLIGLVCTAWIERLAIFDWVRLRGYVPTAQVASFADRTTMNDDTRRLFYVYHPSVDEREAFNRNCPNSEKTIVLGCYVDGVGIYIYNVTDARLDGEKEVTAAHETLHAAYVRLSAKERRRIDALTAGVYEKTTDKRLKETIESYRAKDPSVVPNELHSILGTEIRELPEELETYYKRYFDDRLAVVKLAEQYEAEFTSRQDKVEAYDAQLKQQETEITALKADLDARYEAIDTRRKELDTLFANKQYETYNAAVPGFNSSVRAYNKAIDDLEAKAAAYKQLLADRNAIAIEENELADAIDSRPQKVDSKQ